jgi:phosphoenolpyruvate carboxylase
MSGKIVVSFEVTNMLIMEDTLKRLSHTYTKCEDHLLIARPYYNIEIRKDKITGDSMNRSEINKIKYEYQRDFQIHERTIRGETFEVAETKNEIVITVQ